jgi:HSP20 family protein
MQVRRWDPFTVLARMDREFDDLVQRTWGDSAQAGFVPACEVVRRGEDVAIRFELPGVDVERDVTIEVERGRLVVSGERRDPMGGSDSADRTGLLVRELRYGAFRREFALPQGISPEQVEATYDAGILEVTVKAVVAPEPTPVRVPISTTPARSAVIEHSEEQQAVTQGAEA